MTTKKQMLHQQLMSRSHQKMWTQKTHSPQKTWAMHRLNRTLGKYWSNWNIWMTHWKRLMAVLMSSLRILNGKLLIIYNILSDFSNNFCHIWFHTKLPISFRPVTQNESSKSKGKLLKKLRSFGFNFKIYLYVWLKNSLVQMGRQTTTWTVNLKHQNTAIYLDTKNVNNVLKKNVTYYSCYFLMATVRARDSLTGRYS